MADVEIGLIEAKVGQDVLSARLLHVGDMLFLKMAGSDHANQARKASGWRLSMYVYSIAFLIWICCSLQSGCSLRNGGSP
jgi:hypothetical protein